MFSSNLQLYSLRQAFRQWDELAQERQDGRLTRFQVLDRLVFVIVCAGTSLSQLFGQNDSRGDPEYVTKLEPLFDDLFGGDHPSRDEFRSFVDLYDACRHFGTPKHETVRRLTEDLCEKYLALVVRLWDELVEIYKRSGKDPEERLAEFSSVVDLIRFGEELDPDHGSHPA